MYDSPQLNSAELAMLDALITFGQQKGHRLDDILDDEEEVSGAAEAMEARMTGIFRLLEEHDRVVVGRLREVARSRDGAPTLRNLIELRAQAIRGR